MTYKYSDKNTCMYENNDIYVFLQYLNCIYANGLIMVSLVKFVIAFHSSWMSFCLQYDTIMI